MSGFGRMNPWPFTFGGGQRPIEQEYNALRDALAPNRRGYNVDDDLIDIENYAHATALAQIWVANKRSQNQALPLRMLEELRRWEEILKHRPAPTDSDQSRRGAVQAKLRGMAGNSLVDIEATARAVLGPNYVAVYTVDPDDEITWWPGINPGPPGFEWCSNRCTIGVAMSRKGLSNAEVDGKIARLEEKLDAMMRADMAFCVGIEDPVDDGGFICGIGVCGLTLL